MSEQPTPKPLDAEAETKVRGLYAGNDWFEAAAIMDAAHYPNMANCLRKNAEAIRGLIASLDASRAETAALRESLAEMTSIRDGLWKLHENVTASRDALAARDSGKAVSTEPPRLRYEVRGQKKRDLWATFGAQVDAEEFAGKHGTVAVVVDTAARDSGKASGGGTDAR